MAPNDCLLILLQALGFICYSQQKFPPFFPRFSLKHPPDMSFRDFHE